MYGEPTLIYVLLVVLLVVAIVVIATRGRV